MAQPGFYKLVEISRAHVQNTAEQKGPCPLQIANTNGRAQGSLLIEAMNSIVAVMQGIQLAA